MEERITFIQNSKEPMGFVSVGHTNKKRLFSLGHDPPFGPLCILWVKHKNFFPLSLKQKLRRRI
tara:strand:- start:101 stop:292 length:192 start_codon:yes stop_codon:yes gene_type:complete